MQKEELIANLDTSYQNLIQFLEQQETEKWLLGPENKWTTGQQALHLLQTIKPVNDALSIPKFFLKARYGSSNRAVRNYDTIAKRYIERLTEAKDKTYKASKNMKKPTCNEKKYILNRLQTENKKLQYKIEKRWTEEQLDQYILPHPIMGKMPIRELVMWTAYHVNHHTNILENNY